MKIVTFQKIEQEMTAQKNRKKKDQTNLTTAFISPYTGFPQ